MSEMKLVLFDIDGTLVLLPGAPACAMTRAMAERSSASRGFQRHFDGGTDRLVSGVDRAVAGGANAERPASSSVSGRGLRRFLEGRRSSSEARGRKGIMPGVRDLLDTLACDDVLLGLLTGNYEAARHQARALRPWRYFAAARSATTPDRNALVPVAIERARACDGPPARSRIVVIGDTPHDIACAAAAGAVARRGDGRIHTVPRLRSAGADVVFEDLADTNAVLPCN